MNQQTKKLLVVLAIVLGILLLVMIGISLLRDTSDTNDEIDTPTSTVDTVDITELPTVTPIVPNTADVAAPAGVPDERLLAKQTARLFVERFGSYSTQNNNEHIDSVAGMVTPVMAAWIATQVISPGDTFRAVSTQVLSTQVVSITESTATVRILTRQLEETTSGDAQFQKEGRIDLLKQGNRWLVDGFYWDK